MTDIHHSSDLLASPHETRPGAGWGNIATAVLLVFMLLFVTQFTNPNPNGDIQVNNGETVKLDGRGKWVGSR